MLAPDAAAAREVGREARFAWRRLLSSRETGKSGALTLRAGMEEAEEAAAFADKYTSWEGTGSGGDTPPWGDTPFDGGGCGGGTYELRRSREAAGE